MLSPPSIIDRICLEYGLDKSKSLHEQDVASIRRLVFYHRLLQEEYNALLIQVMKGLQSYNNSEDLSIPDGLEQAVIDAQFLSGLLAVLYAEYLELRLANGRLAEFALLSQLLGQEYALILSSPQRFQNTKLNCFFQKLAEIYNKLRSYDIENQVRQNTVFFNLIRLIIVRLRRFSLLLSSFLQSLNFHWCADIMDFLDNRLYVGLGLSYLTFFWYFPRIIINTIPLLKYMYIDDLRSEHIAKLGFFWRLLVQLDMCWMPLSNDWVWTIGTGCTMFLLLGGLAPIGACVTAGMFGFDAVSALLMAYIELSRLYDLRKQYLEYGLDVNALNRHFYIEIFRLSFAAVHTTLLFIGMALAIPMFAIAPHFVLLAAAIILTSTVLNFAVFYLVRYLREAPNLDRGLINSLPIPLEAMKTDPQTNIHDDSDDSVRYGQIDTVKIPPKMRLFRDRVPTEALQMITRCSHVAQVA